MHDRVIYFLCAECNGDWNVRESELALEMDEPTGVCKGCELEYCVPCLKVHTC